MPEEPTTSALVRHGTRELAVRREAGVAVRPASLEAPGVTDKHREIACARLVVVTRIAALVAGGASVNAATVAATAYTEHCARSARRWFKAVEQLDRSEWPAALLPNYAACATTSTAFVHPEAWEWLCSRYLQPERPTWAGAYSDLQLVAQKKHRNWLPIPAASVLWRRFKREVPDDVVTHARYGAKVAELRHTTPQRRDRSCFVAGEAWGSDGHCADVMVAWPLANGGVKLGRPIILGWQDLHSGMFLGWAVDYSESSDLVRRSFAVAVERYGIPDQVYFDNGRAYAAKKNTGGFSNRFRFRVTEDEEHGLMRMVGVREVHWALPMRGQSKPIEKGWKDALVQRFSKDPEFAGAYLGSGSANRPHTYDPKVAIPIARFNEILGAYIQRHNDEPGRRSRVAKGRSLTQVFEDSRMQRPVTLATSEQLRFLMLSSKRTKVRQQGALIELHGNRYSHPNFGAMAGREVVVRYNPDDLSEIHVYDPKGIHLLRAPLIGDVAFQSERDAESAASANRRNAKRLREAEKAFATVDGATLAQDIHDAMGIPRLAEAKVMHLPPIRIEAPSRVAKAMAPTADELERAERNERLMTKATAAAYAELTPLRRRFTTG